MSLKYLKAIERRKRIRKFIRQGLKQVEMAGKLNVDVTTISSDVGIIRNENATRLLANKYLIDKDIDNMVKALEQLNEIDKECWKIYYKKKKRKVEGSFGIRIIEEETNPQIKLQALDRIKQNNLDRSKLLKLLNPTQISIEKVVYIEKMIPVLVDKMVNIVLPYIPKEKKLEVLEKLKVIDIEEADSNGRE